MKGPLKVTVVEAKNLKDEDVIGKSDPYIELWLDKNYKQKTTTKSNTINPTYNETFTFHVDGQKYLHLKVMDKDLVSDDEIGEGKVELSKIKNGYLETEVDLPKMLGLRSNGKVVLILESAQ
ncbi:calcineurin temperature suppressor cts1 [Gigaspora margarita]|uniref:Calcineurin temperature suppressor cts1 n=1 Tax=Gigaspora margarita TaxID=4874 RepID=A0A8H4AVG9_GIGMA|nr:calcineurin temperature suppressor cts1 [Gigaspora margarita]